MNFLWSGPHGSARRISGRPRNARSGRTPGTSGATSGPRARTKWKRDTARGIVTYTWSGKSRYEIGERRFEATEKNVYETNESDPANSRFFGEDSDRIELRGRTIDVLTSVEIRSDARDFHVTFVRRILENGRLLRERKWQEMFPRHFQ